jgi:hypothetical protein
MTKLDAHAALYRVLKELRNMPCTTFSHRLRSENQVRMRPSPLPLYMTPYEVSIPFLLHATKIEAQR